ncbi:N-acetylmuramoyl-L-alanine amidase [Flavobacterium sp. HSC-61S13]|uniref:N-acetylmuramoyl-L-alanine amidase n=1 Tax=Flavobacterium sp. HSC-61S13 TaxID=2910963 RepID=UPI00209FD6EF|nr:N-acetylmuramoyl-L-alanine amidase [Flavobacterium sp. HSC-61S13]MCP1997295.1 N-acetyl-anhydromuramyl-L-alanine amidase AmpD [Flavobacterium sp. HSC-61S13]
MRKVNRIVIHCTGAKQSQTVESIKVFWKSSLGWNNPGYHRIISSDGTVTELAAPEQIANGVAGYNANSYHISWIGGQNGIDNRTIEQKCVLRQEVLRAKEMFPTAIIVGHRDLSPDLNGDGVISPNEWTKECPSFEVKEWLKQQNI